MRFVHPSIRRLRRWANGEDTRLDRHVANCDHCADRLESLLEESEGDIRSALLTLLEIPEELPERLQVSIDRRLRSHDDLTLIGEFFGLPFRTVRAITNTTQGDDD